MEEDSGRNGRGQVTVCVDVMGGDEPPEVVLAGIEAALAADDGLVVAAVGPQDVVSPFAAAHERCVAYPASQVIGMGEHPTQAVRTKRDSSIVVGCRLVREGTAQGFFSAGSTGACMAAATLGIGRAKGIDRPALVSVVPSEHPVALLDLGATADAKPLNVVQYAHMGVAYAQVALGVAEPRVGLLNIGSEDAKGSMGAQARFAELRAQVPQFVGNAEGTDLFSGRFDVIVTDGFTGNICLKTMEATAKQMFALLKGAVASSLKAKLGAGLMYDSLRGVKREMSGDRYGGALLLGVKGVVAIGHGATSPEAVKNGTLVVADAARKGLVERITRLATQAS